MDTTRIAELLQPFLAPAVPSLEQLENISTYIDLLLRWNTRINLTAIRKEEEIVTRHFGESLFAARHLFPSQITWGQPPPAAQAERRSVLANHVHSISQPGTPAPPSETLIDIGSGAGFPGLPIKIWAPQIHLTLIESNQKKATFLREVARTLTLTDINVFPGRAENYPNSPADVVTLRAVERFETILPVATRLVGPTGRLALLISESQLTRAHDLTSGFKWAAPVRIPLSSSRVLVVGTPGNHL
jgi:16S rRNA (guanine527-N7)-methyltransferase